MTDPLKIQPIREKVLIRAYEWPEKTASGLLYLPSTVQYSATRGGRDPWRAEVIATGREALQVKKGEIVRYQPGNYAAQTIARGGDQPRFIILDELLIYAVEDEKENPIRALKNKIVFLPEALEERWGKLYLPQTREEPQLKGKIVVAGPGTNLKPGMRAMIENKKTWQYFDSAEKRYILTDKENLLCVI